MARDSAWNDNRLLRLPAEHPGAGDVVLRAVHAAVAAKLAEGELPYAAVLAPAERNELDAADMRRLGTLRGASTRLRGLLDRRLRARPSAPHLPRSPRQPSPARSPATG
ncbi:hypothetical protein ACFWY6_24655 [Streptomyces sp. NPDC059037]|uniref:hypothetical protein n=1 Tax=Streptomyces sp. NPDC059037 TaxID=3346710 RepID=UPI003693FBFA